MKRLASHQRRHSLDPEAKYGKSPGKSEFHVADWLGSRAVIKAELVLGDVAEPEKASK